jgi:peptidoglycan/LPS O-acetylase OafA/YrhL
MGPGLSTYLNVLRFGAAMVVFWSHFAYPRFSDGTWLWVRELNLGSDAVVLFFVLSGFVIALTSERKDATLGRFAFARATRIYSVAIPTLILGWGLDQWGSSLAPSQYFAPYYAPLPLWETLLRGLSFSSEWPGFTARLGSNGPYWSLSYEVAYYALFGVAFYLSGLRRAALLVAGVALFGLNILLLMPAWLMGVWLYHRLKNGALVQGPRAALLAIAPVVIYALALKINLADILYAEFQPRPGGLPLRFSNEYLWNGLIGILVTVHLTGMAGVLRDRSLARFKRPVAWLAGASFSIYLVHYPLLQFLHAALPGVSYAGLFGLTFLLCLVFAQVFERPLDLWRRTLRGLGQLPRKPVIG